jgi:hypothetical protein
MTGLIDMIELEVVARMNSVSAEISAQTDGTFNREVEAAEISTQTHLHQLKV